MGNTKSAAGCQFPAPPLINRPTVRQAAKRLLVALERLMAPYGILEIARTGKVALERSSGVNTELLKAAITGGRVPA